MDEPKGNMYPLTLKQAAERAGIMPDTLRQAIKAKRLTATKLGRDWLIESSEIARYIRVRKPAPRRPTAARTKEHPGQ